MGIEQGSQGINILKHLSSATELGKWLVCAMLTATAGSAMTTLSACGSMDPVPLDEPVCGPLPDVLTETTEAIFKKIEEVINRIMADGEFALEEAIFHGEVLTYQGLKIWMSDSLNFGHGPEFAFGYLEPTSDGFSGYEVRFSYDQYGKRIVVVEQLSDLSGNATIPGVISFNDEVCEGPPNGIDLNDRSQYCSYECEMLIDVFAQKFDELWPKFREIVDGR